jgi:signal transduction histidine kinase
MLSVGMLMWIYRISERQFADSALATALEDIQVRAASTHLWLEQFLSGDENLDINRIWFDFALTRNLIQALDKGRDLERGRGPDPHRDEDLPSVAAELNGLFSQLHAMAHERYLQSSTSGAGSELDKRFDAVFVKFQEKAKCLGRIVAENQARIHGQSRRMFNGLLVTWVAILAATTLGLWVRERRRMAAEGALRNVNDELETTTEELKRHRVHLEDQVKARTAELEAANRKLQGEIVERTEAEESIRIYEQVTENMPVGMYVWEGANSGDPSLLKLIAANPAAASMVGREPGDILGKALAEIFPALFGATRVERQVSQGGAGGNLNRGEVLFGHEKRPEGVFTMRAFPLPKNCLGMLLEDITEKATLQKEAMRASHLASLGELAAGVAHEINNPVNGVINYAQIILDESLKKNEDIELPTRIIKEGRRIASIVSSLLTFARERTGERVPVKVCDILTDALDLTGAQLRRDGIILKVDLPETLPQISAHPQQIQQVFLNLINNSRYALNQKRPAATENKVIEITGRPVILEDHPFVEISVVDAGIGIPPNVLDKVITPFFSTKPKGVGTGLGLSVSHGIVTDHGGRLIIHSREGEYTRVEILLPARIENEP